MSGPPREHATALAGRRGLCSPSGGRSVGPVGESRLTAHVGGHVQGVGFRWWVRATALELGLRGSARNLDDGRVEVVAEGPEEACRELLARLGEDRVPPGRPGRVAGVTAAWATPRGLRGFVGG